MNRIKPPPAPRRRALSEEERALWETVVKDARPITRTPRVTKVAAPAAPPAAPPAPQPVAPKPAAAKPVVAPPVAKPAVKPAALDRRQRARIARGRRAIDARIDLHGMTQAEAHGALVRFIRRARDDGATLVLVITGKGRAGEGTRGVLRRQVPHWLAASELAALVIGFEEAHIGHGGEGALYVRLRRARA